MVKITRIVFLIADDGKIRKDIHGHGRQYRPAIVKHRAATRIFGDSGKL